MPPRSSAVPLWWITVALGLAVFVAYGARARFADEVNAFANAVAAWWWESP